MLGRINLPFAIVLNIIKYVFFNNIYVCPLIVTKGIPKVTTWKFDFFTNDF